MDGYIKGLMAIWVSIKVRTISCSCLTSVSIHYLSTVPMTYAALHTLASPWWGAPVGGADRLFNISVRLPADWWLTGAAMQGAQPRLAVTSTSLYLNLNTVLIHPEEERIFFVASFSLRKSSASHNALNIITFNNNFRIKYSMWFLGKLFQC